MGNRACANNFKHAQCKWIDKRTIKTECEVLMMMMTKTENERNLWIGRVLWVYNMTVQRNIGILPCKYILNFEKFIRPRLTMSQNNQEVWKKANERFRRFKMGDKVLEEVFETSRLNVNKMRKKCK